MQSSTSNEKFEKGTVLGHGSFGLVYESKHPDTGDTVAIKSVFQDRRYKNRELAMMVSLDHPNVVRLIHHFTHEDDTKDPENNTFLNLVMEYVPETIYRAIRNNYKAKTLIPMEHARVYMWQMLRSLNYIHSKGICHRDIKPQNLLLDCKTHIVKLCDFGSAKELDPEQPNVAYICSRFYRAPELIFGATNYTTNIDIWSTGCVFAEVLLGFPLFAGESGVDQLVEIIKVLGTPTKDEILSMNPNYNEFKFPQVKPHPWDRVFKKRTDCPNAIDLVSQLLRYRPTERTRPFAALAHPFFDELRSSSKFSDGSPMPSDLFKFTPEETALMDSLELRESIMPRFAEVEVKTS